MATLRPSAKSFGQAFSKACGEWGGAPRKRRFFAKLSLRLGCQRKRLNRFAQATPLSAVSPKVFTTLVCVKLPDKSNFEYIKAKSGCAQHIRFFDVVLCLFLLVKLCEIMDQQRNMPALLLGEC